MLWQDALSSAIEVAIAIAGFSGIVAVIGQRTPGRWTSIDQLRLRILLTASMAAVVFSFVPFILFDIGLESDVGWRIGSIFQTIWMVFIILYRIRQASMTHASDAIGAGTYISLLTSVVVVVAIQVGNAVYWAESWIYVIGILFHLAVAFFVFVALLMDSGRE